MQEKESHLPFMNRRKFLGCLGVLGLFSGYYFGFHKPNVKDQDSCLEAIQTAITHMERVGAAINWYDPSSPLSILNREGKLDNADPILIDVLQKSKEMAKLTDGAFDPTILPLLQLLKKIRSTGKVPPADEVEKLLPLVNYENVVIEKNSIRYTKPGMGMSLDGLGKGYVVDAGIKKLNERGFPDAYVEAGGDLMVTGAKENGKPWTIGIRSPRPETEGKQYIITMHNRAIATSGDYMQAFTKDRRFHHIINPATGFSPPELASASILAPTVAEADGFATAAIVMGPEKAIALIDSLPQYEGFLIGKDLSTYTSKHFFA
ncbi:MAG: hypothetical protein CSA26_09630 [Desulfobacterales bacterium]|nr:MAG: hypothetical protein CSA26_09630 [Desulfobacterales bacterium]